MNTQEKECPICHNMTHEDIPKPTVWLPCGTCEGVGNYDDAPDGSCSEHIVPCTCTDGKVEHEIVWRVPADHEGATGFDKVLELPDLLDADVEDAHLRFISGRMLNGGIVEIANNRGTLRIGPVAKEGV